MPEPIRALDPNSVVVGWDFSTGSVKCLAFDLNGNTLADVRLTTDIWAQGKSRELNLMQLEGQARASVRELAEKLRAQGRLNDWVAGGISATHHTAGRIDVHHNQVRRAICWNDCTLDKFHEIGLARLGGEDRVYELIGGPWAIRYTLSHLVKDERTLTKEAWKATYKMLQHGALAAGYLTGRFDVCSISCAASTGIMNLNRDEWCLPMLEAIKNPKLRELAQEQLPRIITDANEPIGPLAEHVALEAGIASDRRPLIYPTSDDQAAGLIGGGAVEPGQMAIILGTSAVVNSSSDKLLLRSSKLDAMKLNSGRFLWMRCYSNGAKFLDKVIGKNPKWEYLETARDEVPPGCGGVEVIPFVDPEPSRGFRKPCYRWLGTETTDARTRYRAALEAIAYLMAIGVREHRDSGQEINEITVSGGIARSNLMCEILASVLNMTLKRLESDEGPALGAAVMALASAEVNARRRSGMTEPFSVQDAVHALVKYRNPVAPNPAWKEAYQEGLARFEQRLKDLRPVDAQTSESQDESIA